MPIITPEIEKIKRFLKITLSSLQDVDNSLSPSDGEVLIYDETNGYWTSGPVSAIFTFIGLSDTPPEYTGYGGSLLAVSLGEDGLIFISEKNLDVDKVDGKHADDFIQIDGSTSPIADIDWRNYKILNLADPENLKDAVNRQYVDYAVTALGARYYMLDSDSGIEDYKLTSTSPSTDSEKSLSVNSLTNDQYIAGWISPNPGEPSKLLTGVYNWRIYAEKTGGNQTLRLYWKLFERKSDGTEIEIATSVMSNEIIPGRNLFIIPLTLTEDYELDPDSYIVGKIYASVSGSGNPPSLTIYFEGISASHWQIPTNTEILSDKYAHKVLDNVDDTIILEKVKNVDGDGSGLDADTLDGYHHTSFIKGESGTQKIFIDSIEPVGELNINDIWIQI